MRYDDASGAFQASGPVANDDADTLSAGQRGPATGNLITGEGTQYGAAGADSAAGGHITAIAGKGGEDSSFAGGKLSVEGEHGRLTVDADGNYSYLAKGDVENVRDRFTYTLADNAGNSDTAALIVEIGKTPAVIKANAQQIVPGPDGVVTLPPGVDLSDVHVVGRNLVIDMPDGTQLVIIDGAIFVPQLVLGGVEVPATNVAALLIGQEIQPAAGELPPSSGGNFALPPPPLDPGIPLGDLIPPTELTYIPPEPQEVFDIIDREPEIFVEPDGQPASVAAVDQVDEKGLPTRPGEPEGSGEEAAAGANGDPSEATAGNIIYDSPDGVASITLNGVEIVSVGQVIHGDFGDLTITSIAAGQIGYSYLLLDNTSGNDTHDDFEVILTDSDGDIASATLRIDIIDDVPTARPDTDLVPSGQYGPVTGNVITDASAGDDNDGDNGRDTVGADNASISSVSSVNVPANSDNGAPFVVNGQYGVLTLQSDGSYSYVRNQGTPGGVNDVFNYTLTDGDGDTSTTTLTISIGDTPPTIDVPVAGEDGTVVDEKGLPTRNGGEPAGSGEIADGNGADNDDTSETTAGVVNFTPGDGPAVIRIDGVVVTGVGQTFAGDHGILTITAVGPNSVSYSYTLGDNTSGDNTDDSFAFSVTDQDGDVASGNLVIDIIDDVPTALDDTDLVPAGTYGPETGNVITGVGTTSGAAGVDVVGADNSTVSGLASVNVPANVDNNAAGGFVVNGQYGVLTMQADGSYSYVRNADSPGGVSDVFTYTLLDSDGDTDPATLTISIEDARPELGTPAIAQTDDEIFAGGNAGGAGDANPNQANMSGNLAGSGGDGDLDYAFTGVNTLPAGFSVDPSSTASSLKIAQAGVGIVMTIDLDLETGAYTITHNQVIDHPTPGLTEEDVQFLIGVKVVDVDGDSAVNTLTINADDDTPLANNDTDVIASGGNSASGNVITGVGTVEGAANADSPGADTFDTITVVSSVNVPANSDNNPAGGFTVVGQYGTLQMDASGGYTYTRADGSPGDVSEVFTYTYRDDDGDLASATLTINIQDAAPLLGTPPTAQTDDEIFAGGNAGGTGDANPNQSNMSGNLAGSGGDGDLDYAFTGTNTLPAGFSIDPSSTASSLKIAQAGVGIVMTIDLDLETGAYTITHNQPIDHPTPGSTEEDVQFLIGVKVVDADGDSAVNTLTINADDDTPLAFNDTDTVSAGTAVGNVITGVGTTEGAANADKPGADTFDTITQLSGFGGTDSDATGGFTVAGQYGSLQMDASGGYTYTRNDGLGGGQSEVFTYTYRDDDGDLASATLTINIPDVVPTLGTPAIAQSDDEIFAGGNAGGTGDANPNQANMSGNLAGSGGDGDLDYAFTGTNTLPAGFSIDPSSTASSLKIAQAGVGIVVTIDLDLETGAYTITHNQPIDHPTPGSNEEDVQFLIGVKVVDVDGDSATNTLTINVDDDTPLANNDSDTVSAGTAVGNVITGVGTTEGAANADSPGADTFDTITVVSSNNVPANSDSNPAGGFTVAGQYGSLQMDASGGYTYTRNGGLGGGQSDVFTYTYRDDDGDLASATLTINIPDAVPTLGTPAIAQTDDEIFAGGNAGGTGDANPNQANMSGSLAGSGGDGALVYAFTGTNTLPAGFSIDPSSTATSLKIAQAGVGIVMTVDLNLSTGAYTITHNQPIDHPTPGLTEEDVQFLIGVKVTDVDGDSATNTLTINADDDTPLANNDTDAITSGGSSATGNVITGVGTTEGAANADSPGADTFDTITLVSSNNVPANSDSNPAGGFTVVGAFGTLQMDAAGGYTYTRANGNPGSFQDVFTYTYRDDDGDLASATLTINISDAAPLLGTPAIAQTDDEIFTGGNAGGTGDANPNQANMSGNLAGSGGDGALTYGFTGTNTLPAGFSVDPSSTASSLKIAQAGVGIVMTIDINLSTGAYTITHNQPIDHPTPGATEEDVQFLVGIKVTDADGDSATNTLTINADDDTPINFTPVDLTDTTNATVTTLDDALVNDGAANVTRFINDANANPANGENFIGADGFGSLTFTAAGHTNGEQLESAGGDPLTSGDDPIFVFGFGTGVLTATTDATNTNPAAVVFTVTLNPNAGFGSASTYTIDFNQTIDNGAGVTFDNLTSAKAGNVDVRGVGNDDPGTTVDLLLTASLNGANATINTDSDSVGAGNQSMDQGETVRLDFVTNLALDAGLPSGFSYDGHVGTSSMIQAIPQVQGSQTETVAFRVYALNTTVTDAGSPDDTPVVGDPAFSDASTVDIVNVTIDGFDVGQTPVTVALGPVGTWTTIAYGVSARLESDGSVTFTGVQQGDQYGIDTGNNDFNAFAVTSLPAGVGPVGGTSSTNSFDLGIFSIGQVDTGDPVNLSFDVTATDGDGDTSTGTIDVTLVPDTSSSLALALNEQHFASSSSNDSSFSNLSFSNDNSKLGGSGNGFGNIGNTGITSAMVAASGFAMMSPTSLHNFNDPSGGALVQDFQQLSAQVVGREAIGGEDYSSLSLGGQLSGSAVNAVNLAGSGMSFEDHGFISRGLDAMSIGDAHPAFVPSYASGEPSTAGIAAFAANVPTVSMASAEMLRAVNLDGIQHGGAVEQVLADSLGNHAPTIDGLLANLPGGIAELSPIADLASGSGAGVPAWDMGMHGAFAQSHDMLFKVAAVVVHQDAVQPA